MYRTHIRKRVNNTRKIGGSQTIKPTNTPKPTKFFNRLKKLFYKQSNNKETKSKINSNISEDNGYFEVSPEINSPPSKNSSLSNSVNHLKPKNPFKRHWFIPSSELGYKLGHKLAGKPIPQNRIIKMRKKFNKYKKDEEAYKELKKLYSQGVLNQTNRERIKNLTEQLIKSKYGNESNV
jgi:hypothetical protein